MMNDSGYGWVGAQTRLSKEYESNSADPKVAVVKGTSEMIPRKKKVGNKGGGKNGMSYTRPPVRTVPTGVCRKRSSDEFTSRLAFMKTPTAKQGSSKSTVSESPAKKKF